MTPLYNPIPSCDDELIAMALLVYVNVAADSTNKELLDRAMELYYFYRNKGIAEQFNGG